MITDFISTGNDMIDLAISNRPNGGLPVGRLVQISSLQAGGKSLLCGHLIAQVQKKGGIGVYIDTQAAASFQFLVTLGVDIDNLIYIQTQSLNDVYNLIFSIIDQIRQDGCDKPVLIVVDSITATSIDQKKTGQTNLKGYDTGSARLNSDNMKRVTDLIARQKILVVMTSQLRQKIGAMPFQDPYVTSSGGMALQYSASVRLRLKTLNKIKRKVKGQDQIVGIRVQLEVKKNRIGPPFRTIIYDIYFDSGIDNYGSWLQQAKRYKILSQAGSWYSYKFTNKNGQEQTIKFQQKELHQLLSTNEQFRKSLYNQIAQNMVMTYKDCNKDCQNIEYDQDETVDDNQKVNTDNKR